MKGIRFTLTEQEAIEWYIDTGGKIGRLRDEAAIKGFSVIDIAPEVTRYVDLQRRLMEAIDKARKGNNGTSEA